MELRDDLGAIISARRNYEIELTHNPGTEHLSEFELDLAAQIFSEHEKEDQFALRDWCHARCGEWLPLETGRAAISLFDLAEEVGRDPDEVLANATEQAFLDEVFKSK